MKTAKHLFFCAIALSSIFLLNSCSKDEDVQNPPDIIPVTLVKHWEIPLSAKFEVPAPAGRTETGTAVLDLMSDNSLRYSVTVADVAATDSLTMSHLHAGDVVTAGPVILDLEPVFVNGVATDTISGLRQSLADSIQNGAVYLNVHSRELPGGIVRGQLDKTIDFAADIALDGGSVVPPTTTTADGTTVLRLTSDKTLYSNVSIENLDAGDALSTAALYLGAAGATGAKFQDLATALADFGITKTSILSDELITQLKNDAMYVNVFSTNQATNGLVRGQVR